MIEILLYLTGALMLACGVMTITRRNPMHSALWLVATFAAMAILFILMDAEFVAAVQLLVYAGGIMVLYMFVVMLVNLGEAELRRRMFHGQAMAAVTVTLSILVVALIQVGPALDKLCRTRPGGDLSIETLAGRLFTHYLLPFEAVSILLLAALVGSVLVARRRLAGDPEEEDPA